MQQFKTTDGSPALIPDGTVLCQGFGGLLPHQQQLQRDDNKSSASFGGKLDCDLHWYCVPDWWQPSTGQLEGRDGRWSVDNNQKRLTLAAPAQKDYWRLTYYDPAIVKDDAPFVYAELPRTMFYTVSAKFTLTAVSQFDQAGVMIRLDAQHWLKAGIEVVDHVPRLSVVVTNVYSDWSTQGWSFSSSSSSSSSSSVGAVVADNNATATTTTTTTVHCRVRVHCRGESFVVEAQQPEDEEDGEGGGNEWEMVRIAHLSRNMVSTCSSSLEEYDGQPGSNDDESTLLAGVFAACPADQQGAVAVFDDFSIIAGSRFDHNADNH